MSLVYGTAVAPTTDPGLRWPTPWPGLGDNWYGACREHRPTDADRAKAAMDDLSETLATKPNIFWNGLNAARQLAEAHDISVPAAWRLLRGCPGGAWPASGVWCSTAAAPSWMSFKRRVFDAVPGDGLMTLEEIATAAGTDVTSTFAVLCVLVDGDKLCVAIQEGPDEEPTFCRARPGGAKAEYTDVYSARVAAKSAP